MTIEQKAYIAGIIDGEGSIMLLRFHKNQLPSPCITVASVSLELLEWLQTIIGSGSLKSKKNYNPHLHANSFTYTLKYNNALELLELIEPFLVITQKKNRARLIINKYKQLTPRNGRYTEDQLLAKQEFYNEFMAL